MAIYLKDYYGLSTYGLDISSGTAASGFTATATDYGTLFVTYTLPSDSGTWQWARMLRSTAGVAVDQNDGSIVWEGAPDAYVYQFADSDLTGGRYYYYTLWIQDASGAWRQAGAASGLAIANTGMANVLWDRIPGYFQYIRATGAAITDQYMVTQASAKVFDPTQFDSVNETLQKFITVLGWGEELVRNYQLTLGYLNDPELIHQADLEQLSLQMGIPFEPQLPVSVMRGRVRNAGNLAKSRGTLAGLEALALYSSGWDTTLSVSQNLFLSQESSNFVNPVFPVWDATVNYPVGVTVLSEGSLYTSILPALGNAESPPISGSNAWWSLVADSSVANVLDPSSTVAANGRLTGTFINQYYEWVRTWSVVDSSAAINAAGEIQLSSGVSSFTDTNTIYNALKISNPSVSTPTTMSVIGVGGNATIRNVNLPGLYGVYGVNIPTVDPYSAMTQGIPVPFAGEWDPTLEYQDGDLARFGGMTWQARGRVFQSQPIDSPDSWEQVGFDERPVFAYSFYTHSDIDASDGGYLTTPSVAFYDTHGLPISMPLGPEDVVYDSFNDGENLFGVGHIPNPTSPSTSTSSGTLAIGTWYYVVTALGSWGESLASREVQAHLSAAGTVTVNWAAVSGATGYRVYRGGQPSAENVYFAPGNVLTFADSGAAGTTGYPPFGDHALDLSFNTFNSNPSYFSGQANWNLDSGLMELWRDEAADDSCVYSAQFTHGVTNLMSLDYAIADVMASNETYNVAVTFVADTGSTGMHDGLAIHITDASNFTLFARDGIYVMSSGTLTKKYTYPVPVKNGDRMRINLDKTSGSNWTLYINENVVTTGAATGIVMSVPSGAVHHGLAGVPA